MKAFGFFMICLLQFSCSSQVDEKINGVSFVAAPDKIEQKHVAHVLKVNAAHTAIMPFGFIRETNAPQIIFDTDRQWFGETRKGARQYIALLHSNNIKVMLKPQIWISRGEFTGTLKMGSEEKWKALEASYDKFILNYAELAEEAKVSIFCIGTELEQFVKARPKYWKSLIVKIRKIYSGKLTYAANWDEYTKTTFWKDLDYIGVDAYFPLSDAQSPTVAELKASWQPWKEKIRDLSLKNKKPVLFTEFGYRSMDYTAKKPWLVDRNDQKVNLEAQANATEAILSSFWKEDWFAGGYIWKWFIDHNEAGGEDNNRFTPQNKPAQKVMEKFYGQK